ncbi:hypothetical protein L1987_30086 [Smallanthus sonchifolius]|uniref:Uncharacterized protein n=1 Tax=Smallanthus sonchifolius TaxID=185202 RepID=A0ACB9I2J0_9ASTR|nr:hypothetical protein L1987_30086 [Smallanthus sonchifolius]
MDSILQDHLVSVEKRLIVMAHRAPVVLKASIKSNICQDVVVSAAHIRRLCQFGDHPEDPVTLDKYLVRGCFMRIKYDGNVAEGVLNKANLCPQYKYLGHVLLHCLGSRRGGFDDMRETIQSGFVALVLNIPFNFSEMVFTHLKENIYLKGDNAYLMYPRFLQMIIDDQLPLLPRSDIDMIKLEHMTDVTLNRVQTYRGRPTKPPHKRLIGHLANPDYVAPTNRKWRHDNSDSDREDIVVPPADDQDDDDQDGQGDGGNAPNVPSTAATTPTVVAIDSSLPTNPEDVNLDTVLFTDSEDTEDEFVISQQGARLVATKRKRGADQGSSRVDVDVRDADFVPDCPQVSAAPSSQSTPVKGGRKKRVAKRQKFKLVRRTESTSATTATATRSEAPMSTSMPQTQTVSPPIYTTAPTSQPSTIRAESSMSLPTVSLHDQISTLNSLISQLTLQNTEQAQAITSLSTRCNDQQALLLTATNQNQQLSKTVDAHAQRIQRLEEDNKRLLEDLESRRDPTPRIEGARNDGDDGDDGDDDDDDDVDDDSDVDDNNDKDKDDGANAGAASSASKTAEAEARTKQRPIIRYTKGH